MLVAALAIGLTARAADNPPYFVSIKDGTVNMREGPSDMHRIKWVYHRKGLPLEVLSSFEVWRRVRDMDGEIGWIHMALLSRDRTAVIVGAGDAAIRMHEDEDSEIVAEAEPGAIGRLEVCGEQACEVKFEHAQGWIDRSRLWGIHAGKKF